MKKSKYIIPLLHFLGWLVFYIVSTFLTSDFKGPEDRHIVINTFLTLLFASFFYVNYLWLVPKFLITKKIPVYLVLIVIIIFCFNSFGEIVFMVFKSGGHMINGPMPPPHHVHGPPQGFLFNPFRGFYINFVILILSTGLRMTHEWMKNEKIKQELENDKLEAELSLLKSQINPHFILNVLNNICSLARKKSDETENAIIKLSQLLRYNLYDFKADKVPFEKELQYINDYLDIQKIRLTQNVKINLLVEGNYDNLKIEPLLFIPFIENAFKHGTNTSENCYIVIYFKTDSDSIQLSVKNKILNQHHEKQNYSGIGLTNVQRRLKLIYPNKHTLIIKNDKTEFIVDLKIHIND